MTNCSPFSLTFPVLGCGTWAWGNRFLLDYNPQMDQELQKVFNFLVDQGVTFFDTGDSYGTGVLKGRSEILLGQFGTKGLLEVDQWFREWGVPIVSLQVHLH
jgi:aryl-alcohol dehydrogenase-like predicted oxidoreductase